MNIVAVSAPFFWCISFSGGGHRRPTDGKSHGQRWEGPVPEPRLGGRRPAWQWHNPSTWGPRDTPTVGGAQTASSWLLPRAQLAAALKFGDDHRFVSVRPDVMGV